MRAGPVLQGLRAALHAFEHPPVVWVRPNLTACQRRAAEHGVSAWGRQCRWQCSPQPMQTWPAASRVAPELAAHPQHQLGHSVYHQAAAGIAGHRPVASSINAAAVHLAPSRLALHTAPGRLSAEGGFTDSAQARQAAPGINPLQMVPGTLAGTTGSPAASVPQPATSAAAAGEPRRARAIARNLKISPQKLNDFAAVIRRMHVQDAVLQCRYSVKKAAKIVEKARG